MKMKLVGIMTLEFHRDAVRKIFEQHELSIYGEVEITGHTPETIRTHGWWVFEKTDIPLYSNLFFAILEENKANQLLEIIKDWQTSELAHPPKIFTVNVEQLI